MTRIISTLKKAMPSSLWRPASKTYWWWRNRGQHQLAAAFSLRRKQSVRILRQYRNCHRRQRCFIIGNGPSLQKTDLSLLRNETTFGMNRIYMLFQEMGFPTTYYVSINTLVIEQCAEEIKSLTMPKFITWRGRHWLANDPGSIFLDTDYTGPGTFSGDVCGRVFEGSTVTYVALQIAFHMGFETVILIGVDHSFKTKGPANATVISQGDDLNHFAPEYFGKGFKWQLPDLEASERGYHLARQAYEDGGRSVLDATVGGKLTVFPKVDYASLFD
jgi:hypothetical protein